MHKKTMLIVNPVSGKGRVRTCLFRLLKELCSDGAEAAVYMTGAPGDAVRFSRDYGSRYDKLICTGGDGTLHEVINGLMLLPANERPVVGYVPLGTTNDMAATLNIPKLPDEAIDHISLDNIKTVDVGKFGEIYFGYVAAFGAFTDIPYATPQNEKNTLGYLAYILQALNSIPNITPCHAHVEYDGGTLEDEFIFGAVANSTSVAGIIKLPEQDVSLDDGLFEVLLIKMPKNAGELNTVIASVLNRNFNNKYVHLLHTKDIAFTFDRTVDWTCDGEDGGSFRTVSAHNCNKALKILT